MTLEQVLALLSGEVAFYARPGAAIPELTLALDPRTERGAGDAGQARRQARRRSGGQVARHPGRPPGQDGQPRASSRSTTAPSDGKVLITSGVSGIADYGEGDALPDSDDFKQAQDAAGMPDSTGGA